MSTTAPNPSQSWQPAQHYGEQPAPAYAPQQPYAPPANASHGSVLHRWPAWAQNTALAVGAVAILVIVFFAGYFTAHAVDGGPRGGFGTGQGFTPRQFGGNGFGQPGSGNGLGGQSGSGNSFGGQYGSGNGS